MRTALFIDGANLYACARGLGFNLDYAKMLEYYREHTQLVRAYFYTAELDLRPDEHDPLRKMLDYIDYNGYHLVTKKAKSFVQEDGRTKIKGNMDIEIAIDMLELAPHLNQIVLFSGDGDFRRLLDAVQRKGVIATVVSSIKTSPPIIADELRRQADRFVDLNDFRELWVRKREG